jgi:hypothetical protein
VVQRTACTLRGRGLRRLLGDFIYQMCATEVRGACQNSTPRARLPLRRAERAPERQGERETESGITDAGVIAETVAGVPSSLSSSVHLSPGLRAAFDGSRNTAIVVANCVCVATIMASTFTSCRSYGGRDGLFFYATQVRTIPCSFMECSADGAGAANTALLRIPPSSALWKFTDGQIRFSGSDFAGI